MKALSKMCATKDYESLRDCIFTDIQNMSELKDQNRIVKYRVGFFCVSSMVRCSYHVSIQFWCYGPRIALSTHNVEKLNIFHYKM